MTPLPPPSPSTTSQYNNLISILTPDTTTTPLEIDILPSSFPPIIHYTSFPPSLGIPKALLTPLFLIAHGHFFSYLKSRDSAQSHGDGREGSYKQALDATAILLLWDPNHVTAANFRRRHILRLCEEDIVRSSDANARNDGEDRGLKPSSNEDAAAAVSRELYFLESLLTSPLPKHAKSSTLWSFRLWLLSRLHPPLHVKPVLGDDAAAQGQAQGRHHEDTAQVVSSRYDSELAIIMKAAERHPRNYHAWNYARDLLHLLCDLTINQHKGGNQTSKTTTSTRKDLARACIRDIHSWCLQHPRDISGWGFLMFLLREVVPGSDGKPNVRSVNNIDIPNDDDENNDNDDNTIEIQNIIHSTQEFTKKYAWKGESVEWFLNAATELLLEHSNSK